MMNSIKINNVKSYDINSGVYIEFLNKLICKNVSIQSNINLTKVYSFGDIILVLDEVNKAYILSDTVLIDNIFNFRIGSLKFPFIEYYKKEQPRKYGVYDYSTQKILFETTEWIGRDIIGDFIFSDYQGQITCRKVTSAQPLWQFDLGCLGTYFEPFHKEDKPYEVSKFLGVWKNELLVGCSNGLILCINIASGKETRRFHQCPAYQLGSHTNTSFDSSDVFQLDLSADKLIALYAYFYMEIDLDTNEISIFHLDDIMKKNNLSFFRRSLGYALDGDILYTIGEVANHNSPLSKGDRCILAFDIKIKNVVWQYIFEGDSVNTDIPQYANNKLYQLTSSNTLHIFEKQ